MKQIKKIIAILTIILNFTGCFGRIKMIKVYKNRPEFEQFILQSLKEQYGIEFVTEDYVNGDEPLFHFEKGYSGFTGNVRPASSSSGNENVLHRYYTVCNSAGDFATHAHVSMFEKQLRADVEKILKENDIKYSFLEFRGMSRNLNKWSYKDSYEDYKKSNDYESWIYIKLPQQTTTNLATNKKNYAKLILPIMKKLYTLLEPEYNPTIVFYVDDFIIEYYDDFKKVNHRYEKKNCELVLLDLSKFKNYLDWTEHDIEIEIRASELDWMKLLELDD